MRRVPDDWRLGIVRNGHHLAWGLRYGALVWAPDWAKRPIVAAWNRVACALLGHDTFGPYPSNRVDVGGKLATIKAVPKTCSACGRVWP